MGDSRDRMAQAEDWIDLVLKRAAECRKAGVLAIGFEGCSATFEALPPEPPNWSDDKADVEPPRPGPLHDPATYPGGEVTGFTIYRLGEEGQ